MIFKMDKPAPPRDQSAALAALGAGLLRAFSACGGKKNARTALESKAMRTEAAGDGSCAAAGAPLRRPR